MRSLKLFVPDSNFTKEKEIECKITRWNCRKNCAQTKMPNLPEHCFESRVVVTESRVWKLLPEFIRKKSHQPQQQGGVSQSNKKERLSEMCDTKNDEGKDALTTQTDFKTTKSQLGCRKSWTYGDRQHRSCERCLSHSPDTVLATCPEETTCHSNKHFLHVRELKREHSYPGKFPGSGSSLTKNEAQKRLQSWRKTTIARKNSEQQH